MFLITSAIVITTMKTFPHKVYTNVKICFFLLTMKHAINHSPLVYTSLVICKHVMVRGKQGERRKEGGKKG